MNGPGDPSRTLFESVHHLYRRSFRRFLDAEVAPSLPAWDRAGVVPREVFARMAELGFLSMAVPERFGGAGIEDFRFNVVLLEEAQRAGVGGAMIGPFLHTDVCLPYLLAASDEQRRRWLPGVADGSQICAVAMTEPDTGSDLAAIRTRAVREGDHYVLDGAKTFITNGMNADLVIVAATCDPLAGHRGISLFVVERGMPGFGRGRALEKIGLHPLDTAELFFDGVRVPLENRLGEEGTGFAQLIARLVRERLTVACSALASSEIALQWTLEHVTARRAFGRPLGSFQHARFTLAEIRTELEVTRAFIDGCIEREVAGTLTAEEAAMAKWWCTEQQGRALDRCLQLHGGLGYMSEMPIARAFVDARANRIYAGSTETMKDLIGRAMGLGDPR